MSRRSFLGLSGIVLGGTGAALAGCVEPSPPRPDPSPPAAPTSGPRDYAERETYDWAEAAYREPGGSGGAVDNAAGALAWNESYALQSYLPMFRATADRRYLDRLVAQGYQLLAARDDQRRSPDYLGRTGPVWGASAPYTVGSCLLLDRSGAPAVRLCSAAAAADATVDVRPRDAALFDLTVGGSSGPRETLPGLSTDPRSPAYLVTRLSAQAPTAAGLTAEDLRAGPTGPADLRPVSGGRLTHTRYAFLVHTAMLAAPLAEFASLVRHDRSLRGRYAGAARDFLDAARAALAWHDDDWRRVGERKALYSTARGAPIAMDGTFLPHNQYLAAARVRAHLFRGTGDPAEAMSASLMLTTFVSDLSDGAAPVWPYHWSGSQGYRGYGPERALSKYSPRAEPNRALEDTSHGALDVECLLAGHDAGVGVGADPLRRIARTFLRRVAVPAPGGRVVALDSLRAGSGRGAHDRAIPRWVGLARWDRAVFERSRQLFNQLQPAPDHGQVLAATARLVANR